MGRKAAIRLRTNSGARLNRLGNEQSHQRAIRGDRIMGSNVSHASDARIMRMGTRDGKRYAQEQRRRLLAEQQMVLIGF